MRMRTLAKAILIILLTTATVTADDMDDKLAKLAKVDLPALRSFSNALDVGWACATASVLLAVYAPGGPARWPADAAAIQRIKGRLAGQRTVYKENDCDTIKAIKGQL